MVGVQANTVRSWNIAARLHGRDRTAWTLYYACRGRSWTIVEPVTMKQVSIRPPRTGLPWAVAKR